MSDNKYPHNMLMYPKYFKLKGDVLFPSIWENRIPHLAPKEISENVM